jgi:hypothetical protein
MKYILKDELLFGGDAVVSVYAEENGKAVLEWSDGVANVWVEQYDRLALALLRLATLAACADEDWSIGFINDEKQFAIRGEQFLSDQTR